MVPETSERAACSRSKLLAGAELGGFRCCSHVAGRLWQTPAQEIRVSGPLDAGELPVREPPDLCAGPLNLPSLPLSSKPTKGQLNDRLTKCSENGLQGSEECTNRPYVLWVGALPCVRERFSFWTWLSSSLDPYQCHQGSPTSPLSD